MSHTPGPWAGGIATIFRASDKTGKVTRLVLVCPYPSEYDETNPQNPLSEETQEQLRADYTLAAAAPDLLEWLISTVALLELMPHNGTATDTIAQARDAIAKATHR